MRNSLMIILRRARGNGRKSVPKKRTTNTLFDYLASKVPSFIRVLAPKNSLELHEEAWNAYPYCKTVITNPGYMKGNFCMKIETIHCPDRGHQHNAHGLSNELLTKREVVYIDISNDFVTRRDYKESEDPAIFKSKKTGRGPLRDTWRKTCEPVMTCYKLVTIEFKWFGLQNRIENFVQRVERRLFNNFHRQLFCWIDEYHGLTMEDIRRLEDETRDELDAQRKAGPVRGTTAVDD